MPRALQAALVSFRSSLRPEGWYGDQQKSLVSQLTLGTPPQTLAERTRQLQRTIRNHKHEYTTCGATCDNQVKLAADNEGVKVDPVSVEDLKTTGTDILGTGGTFVLNLDFYLPHQTSAFSPDRSEVVKDCRLHSTPEVADNAEMTLGEIDTTSTGQKVQQHVFTITLMIRVLDGYQALSPTYLCQVQHWSEEHVITIDSGTSTLVMPKVDAECWALPGVTKRVRKTLVNAHMSSAVIGAVPGIWAMSVSATASLAQEPTISGYADNGTRPEAW
ncbi:hypothetical protein BC835DRAFT_1304589 [Cytidiella melzeri]|nr:hypothetical protein BC835DRAFT_1304589 [Cytidiella melzeri]